MSHATWSLKFSGSIFVTAGVLSVLIMPAGAAGQSYTLVDLTAVTSEFPAVANDVNDDLVVLGHRNLRAVRWERNAGQWWENLLPPGGISIANAVNNSGTAVGWHTKINSPTFPSIWEDEDHQSTPLEDAWFNDINSSGQIVGRQSGPGALFWEDGEVAYLGGFVASGINDLAQVAGSVGPYPALTASLWENIEGEWEVTELGTLGGSYSAAFEINHNTQIVGWAHVPGDLEHAFLWEDGVMTDLGTLGGSESESTASSVNDLGQVVGWAMTAGEELHAFTWQDGVMSDLNDLIVSDTSLVLMRANNINDLGDIVGWGLTPDGETHAFFARPLRNGDINLDAFVDAADLALLLGSWGPCVEPCTPGDPGQTCPTDLDGDCTVGALDLAILLGNWG